MKRLSRSRPGTGGGGAGSPAAGFGSAHVPLCSALPGLIVSTTSLSFSTSIRPTGAVPITWISSAGA